RAAPLVPGGHGVGDRRSGTPPAGSRRAADLANGAPRSRSFAPHRRAVPDGKGSRVRRRAPVVRAPRRAARRSGDPRRLATRALRSPLRKRVRRRNRTGVGGIRGRGGAIGLLARILPPLP